MALWKKVFIGMIIGIIIGLIARYTNPAIVDYLKPIGDIFINLLKMLVVPILLFSIISGITSVQDSKTLGRVGVKSAIAYILTAVIAVSSGMIIANIMEPGADCDFHYLIEHDYVKVDKFDKNTDLRIIEMIVNFVPKNIFESFATGNTLQVVFFAFFTGIVLNMMGDEGRKLIDGCNMMAKIVFRMVSIIIKMSPYGAGALIAWLVGRYGIDEMLSLLNLVITVFVGMSVEYIMIGVYIMVFARLSPIPFYRKSVEYQAVALSTTSSKASLPVTMQVCRNKLGVSHICSSFVLPLGASVNMAATSIYLGITTVFFAQGFEIHLGWHDYVVILITATLGTIGISGVVGGSIMIMPMILSSVGIPIEGIALVLGIDRILEMMRTVLNITGDTGITLIIDKSEGTLDTEKYYSS